MFYPQGPHGIRVSSTNNLDASQQQLARRITRLKKRLKRYYYWPKSKPKPRKYFRLLRELKKLQFSNVCINGKYKGIRCVCKYCSFYWTRAWAFTRIAVFKGHRGGCLKCGLKTGGLVIDHVIPIKKDWSKRLDISNLQILCSKCNREKGNRIADYRVRKPMPWDGRKKDGVL